MQTYNTQVTLLWITWPWETNCLHAEWETNATDSTRALLSAELTGHQLQPPMARRREDAQAGWAKVSLSQEAEASLPRASQTFHGLTRLLELSVSPHWLQREPTTSHIIFGFFLVSSKGFIEGLITEETLHWVMISWFSLNETNLQIQFVIQETDCGKLR